MTVDSSVTSKLFGIDQSSPIERNIEGEDEYNMRVIWRQTDGKSKEKGVLYITQKRKLSLYDRL